MVRESNKVGGVVGSNSEPRVTLVSKGEHLEERGHSFEPSRDTTVAFAPAQGVAVSKTIQEWGWDGTVAHHHKCCFGFCGGGFVVCWVEPHSVLDHSIRLALVL